MDGGLSAHTYLNITKATELLDFEGYDKILYDGTRGYKLKDGKAYATGDSNGSNALGIGGTNGTNSIMPVLGVDNVVDIAFGQDGKLLIKTEEGGLYATGISHTEGGKVMNEDGAYKITNDLYPDITLFNAESSDFFCKINGQLYWGYYGYDSFEMWPYNGVYTDAKPLNPSNASNPNNTDMLTVYFSNTRQVTERVFRANNNKIYIEEDSDIALPGKRTINSLKTVFNGATFIQGVGSLINIATLDGEICENLIDNPITTVSDVIQVLSSAGTNTGRYALTKDGELWAKGNSIAAWGQDNIKASDYTLISTAAGDVTLEKVKKIFVQNTLGSGCDCIFITENNRIYWIGRQNTLCFVGAKGDYDSTSATGWTAYPKDLTDKGNVLSGIVDKIEDIQMINEQIGDTNQVSTFIVTDDGQLYSMSNNANMSGYGTATLFNGAMATEDFKLVNDGTEASGGLGNKKVVDVKTGGGTVFAVTDTGEVYTWGYNYYGLMGPGFDVGGWYPKPTKVNGLSNIKSVEVSIGGGFAIFINQFNQVWGIGNNTYGQLGDGTTTSTNTFVRCTELEK